MAGFGGPLKNNKNMIRHKDIKSQALAAYQNGDFDKAKNLLERLGSRLDNNSLLLGLLATIEKALGNKSRAIALFERSISLDQTRPDILHNYSGLLEQEDLSKAILLSNLAIKASPKNFTFLERNGYLKWKKGDLSSALEASLQAIKINPNLPGALLNVGSILKELGRHQEALAAILQSKNIDPKNVNTYLALSETYKEIGDFELANNYLLTALEYEPYRPGTLLGLMSTCSEEDLGDLMQRLRIAAKNSAKIVNDVDYIEAACSLGQDFAAEVLSNC